MKFDTLAVHCAPIDDATGALAPPLHLATTFARDASYALRGTYTYIREANPTQLFLFVTPRILRDMDGFREYHQASWERKLLQDDLFGEEVRIQGTKFRADPADAPAMKPSEKLDALEKSGALDGARVKAPLSEDERAKAAREEFLKSQQGGKAPAEGGR